MHQENECKRSSIGNACLMPEFTKRRSEVNVDLIKLTAAPKNSVQRQSHQIFQQNYSTNIIAMGKITLRTMWRWIKLPTELVRFASSLNVPVSTMSVGRYVPLRPVNHSVKVHVHLWAGFFFSLRNYSTNNIAMSKITLRIMWRWVNLLYGQCGDG